jgi:hypothetical protein
MNCRFVSISLALSLPVCLSLVPQLSTAQTSAPNVSDMPRLVPFDCLVRDCNKNPLSGGTKLWRGDDTDWIGPDGARQCVLEDRSSEWTYHLK